ncbi:glycoside hydrolase family 31 protein [Sanguibacter inulinus]|uniref:Family 31 glucosidase n=1 Tax=Sanguibacter inulinus TaxID=60922 RepID=A0A853EUL1_9MICO|nr:TIM-barrel domain-containing protein [Sanguibacter inulinus]MBF0723072.1 family 31 glucosidase [Sanguibacter inulinus]NYS94217.1 family 31 glucosidase [Sanguibacter inulinus]
MSDAFVIKSDRLVWRGSGETVVVEPWGADSVRVRAALGGPVTDTDWALLPQEAASGVSVTVDGDVATLTHGEIRVVATSREYYDWQAQYTRSRCRLEFFDSRGTLLFAEEEDGGALKLRARDYDALPGGTHRARVSLVGARDEKLYGMGQYQQDLLDLKGSTVELAHRNSQVSVPFVMSSAGYGFLWHNPAIGRATFATNRTEWVAESTTQIDYWVTAGATPTDIARNYATATGHAPMMPEHGLGFWQCKLRYSSQEELLTVAREHHRRGLPMDVIVADFFHWPKMGDFRFEDEFWPDPEAMVAELAEMGIELMVSVWPQVSLESENFAELDRLGYLVRSNRGVDIQMSFEGPSRFLDVTNPAAREWLWAKLRVNYPGVKLFWLDEAEPEYAFFEFGAYSYYAGQVLEVGNVYPQLFSRAVYDGQVADGQSDPVNLVRCAWAGSQRYGALVWSGDIHSSFPSMRRQVTAGIHMGVAGIPWFTTDIGGFGGGRVDDPAFHELLVRWFQMGTFMPVMRLHGDRGPSHEVRAADGSRRCNSGADNELWSYGDEVYGILSRYVHLREEMREYTRGLMEAAHVDGQPVMRGLFHDFPEDAAAWDVADQFLYGPSLLVAPVLEAAARTRRVYLPAGASWTSLATGERFDGGVWVEVEAPLDVIPVFARDEALAELVGRTVG